MPASAVIVVIYACVVTCGWSFTVLSGWDILISFWSVLVFFSHPPLPSIIITLLLSLLLLLLMRLILSLLLLMRLNILVYEVNML